MEHDPKTGNGIPSAGRDARPEISEAALFAIVVFVPLFLQTTAGASPARFVARKGEARQSLP